MEKEQRIELYKEAIAKWGESAQTDMVFEECGELIAALAQFKRGRTSRHDVMTELADVSIMVEQIATMIGFEDYEKEKNRKLMRLKEKVNGYNIK